MRNLRHATAPGPWCLIALGGAALFLACDSGSSREGTADGRPDSGSTSSREDAAIQDATAADPGNDETQDAEPPDASSPDAQPADSRSTDARPTDARPADAAAPTQYALTVIVMPGGQVSFPDGTVCRNATCSRNFNTGSTVQLRAMPDPGYYFGGWSLDGNCGGNNPNPQVPVNYPINCGANFRSDAFDLSHAMVRNSPPDIASWPATARITRLDLGPNGVHIDFTKRDGPESWPDVPFGMPGDSLEYTLWIVLNINGTWYTSGCIQYWRGLDRNGGPPAEYAMNWYYDPNRWAPMTGHQPAVGESVGFFVSAGNARNVRDRSGSRVYERSNVVLVPFPTNQGAAFNY